PTVEVRLAKTKFAHRAPWILRSLLDEWVHARDAVREYAIGVDQSIHPRLQRRFGSFDRLCDCAIVVRHFAQLEAFEKGGPSRIDRLGISLPTCVILLD